MVNLGANMNGRFQILQARARICQTDHLCLMFKMSAAIQQPISFAQRGAQAFR